jgi:hypothetical protein
MQFKTMARLRARRWYRGEGNSSDVEIYYADGEFLGHNCIHLKTGQEWLVFANEVNGHLEFVDDCYAAVAVSHLIRSRGAALRCALSDRGRFHSRTGGPGSDWQAPQYSGPWRTYVAVSPPGSASNDRTRRPGGERLGGIYSIAFRGCKRPAASARHVGARRRGGQSGLPYIGIGSTQGKQRNSPDRNRFDRARRDCMR